MVGPENSFEPRLCTAVAFGRAKSDAAALAGSPPKASKSTWWCAGRARGIAISAILGTADLHLQRHLREPAGGAGRAHRGQMRQQLPDH